jgi:hypothetical protein
MENHMREFVFTLRYQEGADELMDEFVSAPDAVAVSTTCCVTGDAMWRVDTLRGADESLDSILDVYLDEHWCNECLHGPPCDSRRRYLLLDDGPGVRTVYGYREEIQKCRSIPYLTVDTYGEGVLFETNRRGNEYRWRIVFPDGDEIGTLYDEIDDRLRDGIDLDLGHVRDCTGWEQPYPIPRDLTPEQTEAIVSAVDAGYYETPRETTVSDLAEKLDVPTSTLQHRLQRAESTVFSAVFERWESVFDAALEGSSPVQ